MLNNYADSTGGFNNNHGQTSRPSTEAQKQQNISSSWAYNNQVDGMFYGGSEPQPMFMGPYDGSTKHSNHPQYPTGTLHQPVATPVVKCHEACCQHYQDYRYPINPAPLRYQPSAPIQPRYTDLGGADTRQYFTDRRSIQTSLSRKKGYPAENGYQHIADRHFPQYMGRGQLHMADSRQQMQMIRSQYPMYPYWGGARGWTGPRMNCPPPPPYHQSVNQGAQLQAGIKMSEASHYLDPTSQKSLSSQHRRGIGTGVGATEIIRPVPEPKRSTLNPNMPSCHEFGFPTGFVPFSEVNKGGGMATQNNSSTCKIQNDKQYHPHQMQYSMQSSDRNMMNCSSSINDLNYSMNFPMVGSDSYIRPGIDDNQQISDSRKLPLHYDSSLGKKRPDLDLRQYLSTWEDDEDESTRLTDSLTMGNSTAPYIVVDCRSLEGEPASKLQERFKAAPPSQGCASKSRTSSPTNSKRVDELPQQNESSERGVNSEFQTQTSYTSIPTMMNDTEKNFWSASARESESINGTGGAFQPLDCSKRDGDVDSKRSTHPHNELPTQKVTSTNDSANMSFDALVSFYGDNRRAVEGNYDFVEMTERLVNSSEKNSMSNRSLDQHAEVSRPCDPRLQQSQLGNNPSIYNKVAPRYPSNSFQHFKPNMAVDPYYNYKHPMATSKYYGFDNPQMVDPNYDYHKIMSEFDSSRLFGSKEALKDPRRIFHHESAESLESAFIDPMRKNLMADCIQDKTNLEFSSIDSDQFTSPIMAKKTEFDNRIDKNVAIRDRMQALNSEHGSDKTLLITSKNGPPEVFRVPYSPEKDLSNKDNVVTLHAGDQAKGSAITVEVPYVQQYSTLVKLSEEISRSDKKDDTNTHKPTQSNSTNTTPTDTFKKPTSFKLKRLPNSKEWAVTENNCDDKTATNLVDTDSQNDLPLPVSNLNMPSLDDIRDGDETSEASSEANREKGNSEPTINNFDKNKNLLPSKNNSQTPQLAVIQPMINHSKSDEPLETNSDNLCNKGNVQRNSPNRVVNPVSPKNDIQVDFESDKISSNCKLHTESVPESDISKHENFMSHKKIQNVPNISNCLSSPNEEFLNSQNLSSGGGKETYSSFHDYTDYFKLDERTTSDTQMPSSPGVESMFEDINHSNEAQLYQSKSCNFQDLTDPNRASINNHNTDLQSFSNIFNEDSDKGGRSDGSVLQMNDKKYLKHIFDDIDNQEIPQSLEDPRGNNKIDYQSDEKDVRSTYTDSKTSPPIPPISLKLNEAKKIWCIAKKDQEKTHQQNIPAIINPVSTPVASSEGTVGLSLEKACHLDVNLSSIQEENTKSNCKSKDSLNNYSKEKENNYCLAKHNKSILSKLKINRSKETNDSHTWTLTKNDLLDEASTFELNNSQSNENLSSQDLVLFQSKNENQCRTVVKYHPKVKILHSLKLLNNRNSMPGTLVFNEKGIHFPELHDIVKDHSNSSKAVAQDLIDDIITQSISETSAAETGNGVCLNKEQTSAQEHGVGSPSPNTVLSVITYDRSRCFIDQEKRIGKTSEEFIQHEKNNIQHQSVIKTYQPSEMGYDLTTKTVHSIFSPMSEGNEEGISNVGSQDRCPQVIIKNNDSSSNKSDPTNLIQSDVDEDIADCGVDKSVTSLEMTLTETNIEGDGVDECVEDFGLEEMISKDMASTKENVARDESCISNCKVKNICDDEVFKGFSSPSNDSCRNKEEDVSKMDNSEIDDALELMGLSNDKNEVGPFMTLSPTTSISLSEPQSDTQNQKWNGKFDNKYSISSPTNTDDRVVESNKCLSLETATEENNSNRCIEPETRINATLNESMNSSRIISDLDNFLEEMQQNSENKEVQNCAYSIKSTLECSKTPLGLKNEVSVLSSKIDQPSDEAYELNHLIDNKNSPLLIPHVDTCEKRTMTHRKSVDELEMPNFKISKLSTINPSQEKREFHGIAVNNIALNNGTEPTTKTAADDFDTRLETSVIVRNNLSSSDICSNLIEPNLNGSKSSLESTVNSSKENKVNSVIATKANALNDRSNELNHLELQEDLSTKEDLSQISGENDQMSSTWGNAEGSSIHMTSLNNEVCRNNEIFQSYCVSESIFLSIDEETIELLKASKLSYLFEYKRNRWNKFKKNGSCNLFALPDQVNCNGPLIKLSLKQDYATPGSNEDSIIIESEDLSSINEEKISTMNEDGLSTMNEEYLSTMNEEDLSTTNDTNSNSFQNDADDSKIKKYSSFENECGIQNNLRDKEMSKDVHSCNSRDSFKMVEPETMLREMFSNEIDIDKPEDIINPDKSLKKVSLQNLTDGSKHEHLPNITQTFVTEDNELSQQTMHIVDDKTERNDTMNCCHPNNLDVVDYCSTDKQSKMCDFNENPIKGKDFLKESDPLCSEFKLSIDDSVNKKDTRPLVIIETSLETLNGQKEQNRISSRYLCNTDSFLVDSSNLDKASETIADELLDSTSEYTELSDHLITPLDHDLKDTDLTARNVENEDIDHEDTKTLTQKTESHLTNKNYKHTGNLSVQKDNTLKNMGKENLVSTHNKSIAEDEFEESSYIIQKDILLSKQNLQSGFDGAQNFDTHFGDNSIETFLRRERKSFTDTQNIKVNSVQDTLKINQNLNQETFPLQCLVEAALALENVDSKQMLIKDSNFTSVYSPSKDSIEKPFKSDELEGSIPSKEDKCNKEDVTCNTNVLTPADKEIFSKFEETNYNLRASTRIVTSSSSNIIPYAKRKYNLKAKISGSSYESNQKKSDPSMDRSRIKKRRGCFTYPRSKKRRKITRDKQKYHVIDDSVIDCGKNCLNNIDSEAIKENERDDFKVGSMNSKNLSADILEDSADENYSNLNLNNDLPKDTSQTDFGGPLLIANDKSTLHRNIFCVQVNADNMDEYVNKINLDDLEVLSENNQTSDNNNSIENTNADVSNVSLENGTSLVIIIEDLEDLSEKRNFKNAIQGEADIILGSIESNCSESCLQQSTSILDDCSDILNSGFSVNESCICPPEFDMSTNCDSTLLKDTPYEMLKNYSYSSKQVFDVNDRLEDDFRYSVSCNDELLTANCYEDMNTNLVSDIGNWPFVEEEVAEFDIEPELPNKIPEEGRKIELKCSLPWKKIFNMSKNKMKKSKTSKNVSGLELGPAKVEVRLKAPSAEWKVISDYHENTSPVVKVKRLIVQRDSDISSYSEKDSEEENESKKNTQQLSNELTSKENGHIDDHVVDKNIKDIENWQPVVRLTRNKELDDLTLSLYSKLYPTTKDTKFCFDSDSFSENKMFEDSLESLTESEANDFSDEKDSFENENQQFDSTLSPCSHFSEQSLSSHNSEPDLIVNSDTYEKASKKRNSQVYETYSPSGCNNALSDEIIYSPSNPHYSPGMWDQDSESNSSCGKFEDDCHYEDNILGDNPPQKNQETCINVCKSKVDKGSKEELNNFENQYLSDENDNYEATTTGLVRSSSLDDSSPDSPTEFCSKNSYDSFNDTPIADDSIPIQPEMCSSKEEDMNENSNDEATPTSEEQSNVLKNDSKATDFPIKTTVKSRKNTQRKMPKNFFVRKKFRKIDDKNVSYNPDQCQHTTSALEPSDCTQQQTSARDMKQYFESSSSSVESFHSDSQSRKSSLTNDELLNDSGSIMSEKSRLDCVFDADDPLPQRINELSHVPVEKIDEKQRLRDGGRGIKRPSEGHSKEDMKRRRKSVRRRSNSCEEYDAQLQTKEQSQLEENIRSRELHHCLLCHRSFSSITRYHLHKQGRSHRHLELTQRHTVHAIHRLLVGTDCPRLLPLSDTEQQALQWQPSQPGFAHFYHDYSPLQTALQEHNEASDDSVSEARLPID